MILIIGLAGQAPYRRSRLSSNVRPHNQRNMLATLWTDIIRLWDWSRANDLPNWAATAFSLIVWPLVLISWQRRRVNSVAGPEVHFLPGGITIHGDEYPVVDIRFTNHTGSVVYVSGARVRACTRAFAVPTAAARDVSSNSYHLKFNYGDGAFTHREATLQTAKTAQTCMPAANAPDEAFLRFQPHWLARLFRHHKYFVLEYTALVGNSRYLVSTRY